MLAQPVKRRFTVDEYHRMGEAGIFRPDERVEVHRDPAGADYRTVEVVPRTGRLSPAALAGVQIAVAEIL